MGITAPTARDEERMDRALAEARTAIALGRVGVGALLAWRDETLALDHNQFAETGDATLHAEMVVLHEAARRITAMSDGEKRERAIYVTLEPCLMCLSALSFVGVRRVAYAAPIEDANAESWIVSGITSDQVNPLLMRGPLELVPGVRRAQGREILARMGKLRAP